MPGAGQSVSMRLPLRAPHCILPPAPPLKLKPSNALITQAHAPARITSHGGAAHDRPNYFCMEVPQTSFSKRTMLGADRSASMRLPLRAPHRILPPAPPSQLE